MTIAPDPKKHHAKPLNDVARTKLAVACKSHATALRAEADKPDTSPMVGTTLRASADEYDRLAVDVGGAAS